MVTQLREYRIAEGRLEEFTDAWRSGVRPLRERAGFRIDGAWTVDRESRFVWLLSLDGTWEEFEARDTAYYASPERTSLDPDPAAWVVSSRRWRLRTVD